MKIYLITAIIAFLSFPVFAQKTETNKVDIRKTELMSIDSQLAISLAIKKSQIDTLYKEITQIEEKRKSIAGAIVGLEESVKALESKPTTFTLELKIPTPTPKPPKVGEEIDIK